MAELPDWPVIVRAYDVYSVYDKWKISRKGISLVGKYKLPEINE